MQALFAPAVSLMNRLSYSKKFVFLGGLSILAVMVVMLILYRSLRVEIDNSRRELVALKHIKVVTQAFEQVGIHRGLAAAVISGNSELKQALAQSEQATTQALNAITHSVGNDTDASVLGAEIESQWHSIQSEGASYSTEASYNAHTQLKTKLALLANTLGDHAVFAADRGLDTYHLITLLINELPTALENIGRLKAHLVAVLTQKQITAEQKIQIRVLQAGVEQSLENINAIINHTTIYNPNLKPILDASRDNISNAINLMTHQVVPEVLQEHFVINPEYFYSGITLALHTAYVQIYDSFLPATEQLITARIADAEQILLISISVPMVLFLVLTYFAVGVHLSVTRRIAVLAQSASAFSAGHLKQRVLVDSQDELGQAAASFNQLADGFEALLDSRRYAEMRLQSIIDTALDAVVQMSADGLLMGWNKQAEEIFGWSFDEVRGQLLHNIIIPERFREGHLGGLERFLTNGQSSTLNRRIEIVGLHKDGHEFPIELAITPNQLADSLEFSAFIRDISAKKQTLQILRNSEQRHRAVFESSRDAMMILSMDRGFLSGNLAAIQLFGCSNEAEFMAQDPVSLSPEVQPNGELSSELARVKIDQALTEGSVVFEWQHQRIDGQKFSAEVQLSRLELDTEAVLLAVVRDVTASKLASAALVTSEGRTRAVLRTMADAVVLIDLRGQILLVNDATTEIFGYDEDELLGQNVNILMPEPHRSAHDGYLSNHLITKDKVIIGRRVEVNGKRKDGQMIPIELAVNELIDDQGSTYIGVIRNIAERKAIEEARESARLEAERLAHAKSDFLANMSHEIRTPLNAIIGLAKINIRDQNGHALKQTSERILDAGQHLLSVVNDILDFSKIEAGKMNLDPQPFMLDALIDDTLNLVEIRAKEKGLSLVVERPDDLPNWVLGDALRLRQILVNLLSNAVKFTEQGYVSLAIRRQQCETEIIITDSGIGMSSEQLSRLFTAFEQADSSTTRKFGGTGLGLAISRNLAQIMGGDIKVKSTIGLGSQFILNLPLPTCEGIGEQVERVDDTDGLSLQGLRVLAADDVMLNRIVLEDLLHYEGAQVTFAENGRQALDIFTAQGRASFDLILMDIQMPVMDGYKATQAILEIAPDMPILGLTAHAMPEERLRCLQVGMRERVTKPIDVKELVAVIRQYVTLPSVVEVAAVEVVADTQAAAEAVPTLMASEGGLIDWPALQKRFNGRQDFINKLIDNTLSGAQQANVDKLKQAALEQDFAAIKFIAHSTKGLAGVFFAQQLHGLAEQAEQAAVNQTAEVAAVAKALADSLQQLLTELRVASGKDVG